MGVLRSILKANCFRPVLVPAKRLWARANDSVLNIDTLRVQSPKLEDNCRTEDEQFNSMPLYRDAVPYESPDYWYVRKIRNMLFGDGATDEVFFDLGSGKGRILCVMARWPLKRIVGVEFEKDLCQCAKNNAARMRGRRAPIEVVCQDAATADLCEGTTFFLFNPFGADTLRAVCENIHASLNASPRRVRLVYYNAVHEAVLHSAGWLHKYDEFNTHSGMRVGFWTSS